MELRRLSDAARAVLRPEPGDLLAHGDFTGWPTALSYLGQRARGQRLAVVLDEFPYLVHVLVAREAVEAVGPGEALAFTARDLYAGTGTAPPRRPRRR